MAFRGPIKSCRTAGGAAKVPLAILGDPAGAAELAAELAHTEDAWERDCTSVPSNGVVNPSSWAKKLLIDLLQRDVLVTTDYSINTEY